MAADRTPAETLTRLAAAGDETAWQTIVDRYVGLVWAICRRSGLCEADTAKVIQAVFTRAFDQLSALAGPAALPARLANTARQECVLTLRGSGPADAGRANPSEGRAPELVRVSLSRLPAHCRRMVGLGPPRREATAPARAA